MMMSTKKFMAAGFLSGLAALRGMTATAPHAVAGGPEQPGVCGQFNAPGGVGWSNCSDVDVQIAITDPTSCYLSSVPAHSSATYNGAYSIVQA
ncbi:hypothetical protein [Mariniluteicoccus flavus]